jgi:tetratricopeptide (TPR) repeat protein
MTGDRWTRIERIYHAALERPVCDRAAFVRKEAGGDLELVAEIEALLAYDERPAAFMQSSAFELTARAIAAGQNRCEAGPSARIIGSYEILRSLGAGGMGDVYLARDTRLARNVALKMLRPDLADPDWIARFRHEALAASALNHPNILTIYEIGEHDGTEFIATEHVEGITLRERLKQGPVPAHEQVDIALQIAEGLAAAHEAGVVHRDIKPDNLMLRADGLVKILDFGIATRTGSDVPRPVGPTGPDGVIGTAGYMSPEQVLGQPVDVRTDLWSLGIVLYEMATGRLPAAAMRTDAHGEVMSGSPVGPGQLACELPAGLAPIVGRALSKTPDDRHATARELARDLRELRRALERGSTLAPDGGRQAAQRVRVVSRTGALLLILATVIAGLLVLAQQSEMARGLVGALAGRQPAALTTEETRDPVAYQLYAKGRYHVLRRTPADLRKGLEYLHEAVAKDPAYARAHAKLADAYILLAMTSDVAPRASFPQAKTAAERALSIDPGLSEARVSMGIIKFWYDWDWSGAEAEFKRAIAVNQPDPLAHTFYGHLLSNLGDHTGALQQMRRALDYEPHSALANALFAQCLYYQGHYDESLTHLRKTLDLDPELWLIHNMMGRIYGLQGMDREALQAFDKATELGGSLIVRAAAGYTLAASGKRDEARAILDQLERRAAQAYVPPSNLALVHLGLDEHGEALDRLEEAVEARDLLLTFLTVEPRWAGLAGHPRFTALLGKVGLKQ